MTTTTTAVIFQAGQQIYQIGECTDSEQSDYVWNRNTGDKVKFPYQKTSRELFWSTLPEGLSAPKMWAYWMVELYELNSHSRLPEIQEATQIFAHVLRTIVGDVTIPTPLTMYTKYVDVESKYCMDDYDNRETKIIDAIYV